MNELEITGQMFAGVVSPKQLLHIAPSPKEIVRITNDGQVIIAAGNAVLDSALLSDGQALLIIGPKGVTNGPSVPRTFSDADRATAGR